MFNRTFLAAILERAVKTFAQSAAALLVGNGTGLLDTDWVGILSVSGMAAVVSLLTSVGTDAITGDGPSAVKAEVVTDERLLPADPYPENYTTAEEDAQ